MDPTEAIIHLLALGWTEAAIATATSTTQPTINRIKRGAVPSYTIGEALVRLAASAEPTQPRQSAASTKVA